MDITRLRTLTLKSKAFFYYDPNWTIEKLITDKSGTILKAYYEQEKISFNQEVLDILKSKYPHFIEIEKPSKLIGWRDIIFKNSYDNMPYDKLLSIHRYQMMKYGRVDNNLRYIMKKKKVDKARVEMKSKLNISKKDLQGKNHGR